jgi:hypothetical protein
MGTSPDEDLISCVHVAHGLEVSSQTNSISFPSLNTIFHQSKGGIDRLIIFGQIPSACYMFELIT